MVVVEVSNGDYGLFDDFRYPFGLVVGDYPIEMAGSGQCNRDNSLGFTAKCIRFLSSNRFRAEWAFGETDGSSRGGASDFYFFRVGYW